METFKYTSFFIIINMVEIKIISLINMKGGVGKTTLSVNLAIALAKYHNKKVLLIDNDPQFNTTQSVMSIQDYFKHVQDPKKCTILDIYRERLTTGPSIVNGKNKVEVPTPSLSNCTIRIRNYSGSHVDLLPATLDLMELDRPQLGDENKLSFFIGDIKRAYDFIIIDCPPTMSLFTLSAYIASDAFIIPIKPDHLSSIGISLLDRAILRYQKTSRKNVISLGVIFTLVKQHPSTDAVMLSLKQTGRYCFSEHIKQGVNAAKAVGELKALFEFNASKRPQGEQIKSITSELLKRITEIKKKGDKK